MAMPDIPMYVFTGFLESGKTKFIQETLEDERFNTGERTLLLVFEEGEEEYDISAMPCQEIYIRTIEEPEELNPAHLQALLKACGATRVVLEYNGMWQMEKLYREVLPANWVLYQIMTFVQAPTFELFVKNMGQLMMEKITNADMIVFNRCDDKLKESLRARNLRMVNRRADIYLEDNDGNSEDYLSLIHI